MRTTVKAFAALNGIDVGMANGVLRFMESKGVAKIVDHVRPEGQLKGKASAVFEIEETVTINVNEAVKPMAVEA